MIKETYLAKLKETRQEYPNATFIRVNRSANKLLAPSALLLNDFTRAKRYYEHNAAFELVDYTVRFRRQIIRSNDSMAELFKISLRAKEHTIFFVCFEGMQKACHRRILMRICESEFGAKVHVEGVEIL